MVEPEKFRNCSDFDRAKHAYFLVMNTWRYRDVLAPISFDKLFSISVSADAVDHDLRPAGGSHGS